MDRLRLPLFVAVALLALGWFLTTPGGLLGKADAIGYAVCHRIDLRSLHLGERQLPLCARCSGMYLGALVGLVFQAATSGRYGGLPSTRVLVALAVLVLAFGIDGLNSFLHLLPVTPFSLYEPSNPLRTLTGSGMGVAISVVLYPAFHQTVWVNWQPVPALGGLRSLGALLLLILAVDVAVLSENVLLLYPLALLSAATVVLLLLMVYTMLLLMAVRAENQFHSWRQLAVPLMGGLLLALFQIVGIDAVRFALTGTWDGFHFGAQPAQLFASLDVSSSDGLWAMFAGSIRGGFRWIF